MASFCFTISCASKKKVDEPAVTVEKSVDIKEPAPEVTEAKADDNQYTCLVAGDQRIITLNKDGKRCTVDYTKSGDTKEVAWGKSTPSICTDTFSKIRTNIESAGFKCGMEFEETKKEANSSESANFKVIQEEVKSN